MTTKRPDSFEEFQRKQAAKRALLPPTSHNTPDLPTLSYEETVYIETARGAFLSLKKTFELWIGIARGLRVLKDKAERIGGRFAFDRLREREGLGGKNSHGGQILNKTRVSRLLAILDHIAEVETWRAKLTEKQRFEWACPEAIHRHCPVFAKPEPEGPKPMTKAEQDRQALAVALEENFQLKQREDGDTFNPKTSTPRQIALALFGQFEPYRGKAEKVARELLAIIEEHKAKRGKTATEVQP